MIDCFAKMKQIFLIFMLAMGLGHCRSEITTNNCQRQLPQALIIGVKKSGTFALLKYLSLNPNIKPAIRSSISTGMNEIHFFDRDANWEKGLAWYQDQMPLVCDHENETRTRIVIEKTPGYFRSQTAPQRIRDFNSTIKLIVIVREPLKRLQSELTHCDMRQKSLNKTRKCANANQELLTTLTQTRSSSLNETLMSNKFVRNSLYYLDMLAWSSLFNLSSQLLVIDGEQFIQKPWIELNRVERFLGLAEVIRATDFYFDRRKRFYCVSRRWPASGKCLGKNKGRKRHIFLSPLVQDKLKTFFAQWNQRFFSLIDRQFDWN